ncbi:MAG: SpoIIE family protein phosphatase [Bacteroidota bacterium]|nr:SpoIIE family protein phosphatase [Bacteroidota bacterium]
MKRLVAILLIFVSYCAQAQRPAWTSYDLYLGDTVNIIEKNNAKQGRWVLLGKDKKGRKYKFYKNNQIVEDGNFKDGKKIGVWKSYHQTGKLESEIKFVNDEANGAAKFYNKEGRLTAEGNLKGRDFEGDYFIYDAEGNKIKRNSKSKYKNSYLSFSGKIDKFGKELNNVRIVVERDNFEIYDEVNNTDGTFKLKLELNFEYIIRFSKEGFNDVSLIVDGNVHNLNDTSIYKLEKWKVQLSDNIANSLSSDFMSLLLNKPAGKIYFSKRKKRFTTDGAYVNLFNKQVKGISESTKFILAQTADDNKKLEIENLRMEAEKKMSEIAMLKKEQDLKEAELRQKEAQILAEKLAREKQESDIAMAEQQKRIKDLQFEQQRIEIEKQALVAQANAKELERLAVLKKVQEYELKEKQGLLTKSNQSLAMQLAENEKSSMQLEFANKEKAIKETEIKQQKIYFYFMAAGLLLVGIFAFFIFRSFQQKKKANTLLEKQSKEITLQKHEIETKSKLIELKNIETEQSILYAKRIQHAILPPKEEISLYLKDYFILYKSKDIVSGDFYFFSDKHASDGKVYLASVDCTGHGVPGAFMSMIGYEKLKDAVDLATEPGKILMELNKGVKSALRQSTDANSTRDGMDLSLCAIPTKANGTTTISFAGANRPLWIIKKDSTILDEIKATKVAIGGLTHDSQEFQQHDITLSKGDTIYMFSDGYADQFGGPKKKKLMTGKFKDIILSIQHLSIKEQHDYLNTFIEEWMDGSEQVDDILVIGVKV